MARSAQFAEICFDYSPRSRLLIMKLATELMDKLRGEDNPSIGACIRRVSIQSSRDWIIKAHSELYELSLIHI